LVKRGKGRFYKQSHINIEAFQKSPGFQHEMIRSKMKTATIAPKIKRMIGMMPDELLINHIINAPESGDGTPIA